MLMFLTIASAVSLLRHAIQVFGQENQGYKELVLQSESVGDGLEVENGRVDDASDSMNVDATVDDTLPSTPSLEDVPSLQTSESNNSLHSEEDGPTTPPLTPLESCPLSRHIGKSTCESVDYFPKTAVEKQVEGVHDNMWRVHIGGRMYLDVRAWDVAKNRYEEAVGSGLAHYTAKPSWVEYGLDVIAFTILLVIWISWVLYTLRCYWSWLEPDFQSWWTCLVAIRMVILCYFMLTVPVGIVGFP